MSKVEIRLSFCKYNSFYLNVLQKYELFFIAPNVCAKNCAKLHNFNIYYQKMERKKKKLPLLKGITIERYAAEGKW